jgi:hypothetical protein
VELPTGVLGSRKELIYAPAHEVSPLTEIALDEADFQRTKGRAGATGRMHEAGVEREQRCSHGVRPPAGDRRVKVRWQRKYE